jgi:enoyl-CoA hydratase/carnithine racemase
MQIDLGTKYLDARIAGGILHVRIDRPEKRNAITQGGAAEPRVALRRTIFS